MVLDFGNNDSLTINGTDTIDAITFVDGKKTTTKIYDTRGTFDAKKTSVTIKPNSKGFAASLNGDDGILTISGASVTSGPIGIVGNKKNNYILAGASGASLYGGEGNDTLVGGSGNDVFVYESSLSGNDVIVDYGKSGNDSIGLGDSLKIEDVTVSKNDDVVIKVGSKGSITVKEGNSKAISLVGGGVFKDGLFSSENGVTLPATYKGEYAISATANVPSYIVDASATKKAIKLTGKAGQTNSLIGGKANDTLSGGTGNNYLDGGDGKNVFIFTGGNDSIANFKPTDKISVGSAKETSFSLSSDKKDLILGYENNGSISIQGGAGVAISFIDDKKKTTIKKYDSIGAFDSKGTTATLAAGNTTFTATVSAYANLATINAESITAGMATVTGNAKANVISAGASGAQLNGGDGNDTLIGGAGNDVFVYGGGTKPGNDTIDKYSYSGTNGNDTISLASGLTVEDVTVKKDDLVFKVGKNSLTVKNAKTNGDPIKFIVGGNEVIFSGGEQGVFLNASSVSATLPTSYKWAYKLKDSVTSSVTEVNASNVKKGVTLSGADTNEVETIIGGKGGDTIKSGKNNDEAGIALTGGTGNDVFVYEGGHATITDFFEGKNKISVAGGLSYSGFDLNGTDVRINYGDGKILTIAKGKDSAISFMEGDNGKKTTTYIYTDKGLYDAKKTSVEVHSTVPTFEGDTVVATIDASSGHNDSAIIVNGNTKNNYIIGGDGNDTLNGKLGNDTLTGGGGDDVFVYENNSGNDVIVDYSEGDRISLGSGAVITDVTTKNDDVTVKIGKGSVVIKGGTKLSEGIVFEGANNGTLKDGVFTAENKSILFPSYKYTSAISVDGTVDASSVKGSVTMTGGEYLIGGNGKDSLGNAATLWGGKGNDTLFEGGTYIYHAGEGTDVIKDYAGTGEDLKFYGKGNSTATAKVKKGTFKNNDLSLAIEGGGTVILNGIGAFEGAITLSGESWYVSADKKSITKTQPSSEE